MKKVTEEMQPQKEWFKRAKDIRNIEELAAFAKELLVDTEHDYGTVCHAIAALALGAGHLGSYTQGITGFQAGFVMWDFIKQWEFNNNKCGLKIINYDNMLYPQYGVNFEKVIKPETFKRLQEVAAKELSRPNIDFYVHPEVKAHWQSIVDGNVPFGYKVSETQ